jgi:predicted ATPase
VILNATNIAVITGGPGSGKTTLCKKLSQDRVAIGCESGRAVLARKNGHELRQTSPHLYAVEILKLDIEKFTTAKAGCQSWLFDRGFPDNAGFLDFMGLHIPEELDIACRNYRYAGPIFAAPPWREIYHGDQERIQDWHEAVATHEAVIAAWARYGYGLVELPKPSVDERAFFVKNQMV